MKEKLSDSELLVRLNQIRLDENLTYEQLAEEIGRVVGGEMRHSVVFKALNRPTHKPFDRTLHKFRLFVDAHERRRRRKRSRRKAAA